MPSLTDTMEDTTSAVRKPPTPLPSLREQQQRFCAAQHTLPPLQRRAPPPPTATLSTRRTPPASCENGGAKRKRGRPRKHATDAAVGTHQWTGDGERGAVATAAPKPAYVVQKEEQSRLSDEVRVLQERVEWLRRHAGLPTTADRRQVQQTQARNAEMDAKIHANRRHVVQLQSQVMQELALPVVNPLASRIHLPRDMDERRAVLRGLKDLKIRRAAEIGIERFRFVDMNVSYMSEERFTTDDGVFHCNRWELVEFPQFHTARQMFDALLFWMYNVEISVTEMVNQVAVREDDGDEDSERTIWNHRIVTTTEDVGCPEELNTVGFAQFFDHCDLLSGEPLGVIAIDTVEHDDLYPYKPQERTRKDVQTFHLFREIVDPHTKRKAVVMQVCLLNAQLPPQFPVESHVLGKLHAYMSRWVELMKQYLREYTIPS